MTTTLEKPIASSNILVLNGITWSKFEEIQTAFQDLSFRFTYLDELLEIYYWQGSYQKIEKSILLPDLDMKMFVKYINYYDQYDAVNDFLKELN